MWAIPPREVYLPSEPARPGVTEVRGIVREVAEGELVIAGYTSTDQLVRCCGPDQLWVRRPAQSVEDLRVQLDATVVLDVPAYDALADDERALAEREDQPHRAEPAVAAAAGPSAGAGRTQLVRTPRREQGG